MKIKKTITLLLALTIFIFAHSQAPPPTKQQQDSVEKLQKDYAAYIDTLVAKTTLKQFMDYLYATVTAKYYNEGKWLELYNYFLNNKGDEWLQKRSKPKQK